MSAWVRTASAPDVRGSARVRRTRRSARAPAGTRACRRHVAQPMWMGVISVTRAWPSWPRLTRSGRVDHGRAAVPEHLEPLHPVEVERFASSTARAPESKRSVAAAVVSR
jgi:hypothetical protein